MAMALAASLRAQLVLAECFGVLLASCPLNNIMTQAEDTAPDGLTGAYNWRSLPFMATETTTRLIDDLDNKSDADTTIRYTWQGQDFEIDPSKRNADECSEVMKPYLAASRAVRSGSSRGGKKGAVDMRAVRAWAQENGVEVSPRACISSEVIEQYQAAQQ